MAQSQPKREITFTSAQVRTIISSKENDINALKSASSIKDDAIEKLQLEIQRLGCELQTVQNECDRAKQNSAISLTFTPLFSAVRLNDTQVNIVVFESEALDRAMWDFAGRAGKFFDFLEFRSRGAVVPRGVRVDHLQMLHGDKVEVHFVGTEQDRLAQPEPN